MKQIDKFWLWFQDNEQSIKNAFFLGINKEEVQFHFMRNLDYVSKRIGFMIKKPADDSEKSLIVFTGAGYRKLFPKLIALEEQAPKLEYFRVQAFIKPLQNKEEIKKGQDVPAMFYDYYFKMSELQFSLLDFNVATKQIKIAVYIINYEEIRHFEQLYSDMQWLIMEVIGEIKYRKHIKHYELKQSPQNPNGLMHLVDLQEYIDYLYKISSRKKSMVI